jgi:hypothetical protein
MGTLIASCRRLRQKSGQQRIGAHFHATPLPSSGSRSMTSVHFSGRVLPVGLGISIPNQPTFHWKADDVGLEMTFRLKVQNGSIVIDCDVNEFDPDTHFMALFLRASDIATVCVDLTALSTGKALTAILDTFTDPAGASTPVAVHRPSLAAHVTAVKLGTPDFDRLAQTILAEPPLFAAIRDLIGAISSPQRARWNCTRAIRGLWHYFERSGGSPESAGLALRENLQISWTYLHRIMRTPTQEDQALVMDVVERTWIVMNRFLEYRRRGGQPLPLSEFPLLT